MSSTIAKLNEDLEDMRADIALAKTGGIPKNVYWPMWQKGGETKRIAGRDRIVYANEYNFWEVTHEKRNVDRWLVKGFDAVITKFKHNHRN